MCDTTLVTLVGEQPIPVLLPLRALRPSLVCYVHTERTEDVAHCVAVLNPDIAARYVLVDPYDLQAIQTSLVAAVQASGLPPNVEACVPGTRLLAMSGFATMQPIAVPPPRAFARVMMSGVIPKCW